MLTLGAASALTAALAGPAVAAPATDTSALREAVTVEGVRAHQAELQAIADANGGTRASGTPGYDASAAYVTRVLEGAGYTVSQQTFTYELFQQNSPSVLDVTPDGAS